MIKISFDFDDTLSLIPTQAFSMLLAKNKPNVEQWIVTSRLSDDARKARLSGGLRIVGENDDLFEVAKKINIPESRIVFTNLKWKRDFFKGKDFFLHVDDYDEELRLIRSETKTFAIDVTLDGWEEKVLRLINMMEKSKK